MYVCSCLNTHNNTVFVLSFAETLAKEAFYRLHANKRLVMTVIDTTAMTTQVRCALSCLRGNGCQAANFLDNNCQLIAAPSNEYDWMDDVTSTVIILGIDLFPSLQILNIFGPLQLCTF